MTYLTGSALQGAPNAAVMENCRHLATLQNQRPSPPARFVGSRRLARTHRHGQALESLEEMLLTSRGKFVAIAYSILGNKEDAEDAVQNAFLSAYLHLRAFAGHSALRTWFTRIVMNAALMIRRKRKPSRFLPLADPEPSEEITPWEHIPASEPDPEKAYASEEALAKIDAQLATMRPALREAFVVTYYQELSNAEACHLLGIPLGTFKARLFRARRQVANRVSSPKYLVASCSRPRNRVRSSRKEVGTNSPLTVPS